MPPRCALWSCDGRKSGKGITLFSFPRDPTLRAEWLRVCGLKEERIPKTPYLCSLHFSKDDVCARGNRFTLKTSALPKITGKENTFVIPKNPPPLLLIGRPLAAANVDAIPAVPAVPAVLALERMCRLSNASTPFAPFAPAVGPKVRKVPKVPKVPPNACLVSAMSFHALSGTSSRRCPGPPPPLTPLPRRPKVAFKLLGKLSPENHQPMSTHADCDAVQREDCRLEQRIGELERALQAVTADRQDQHDAMQRENAQLQAKVRELERTLQKKTAEVDRLRKKSALSKNKVRTLNQKIRRMNTRLDKTVMYYARKEQESIHKVQSEKAVSDIEALIKGMVDKGLGGEDMDAHLPSALALYYRTEAYKHLLKKFQKKRPPNGIVSDDARLTPALSPESRESGREVPVPSPT